MANVNDMADVIWTDPGVGQNYVRMADVLRQNDLGKQAAIYQNLQRNQEIAAADRNAEALRGLQAGQLGETSRQADLQAELYRENLKNQLEIAKLRPTDRYGLETALGLTEMNRQGRQTQNESEIEANALNQALDALDAKHTLEVNDIYGSPGLGGAIYRNVLAGRGIWHPTTSDQVAAANAQHLQDRAAIISKATKSKYNPITKRMEPIQQPTYSFNPGATGTGAGIGINPNAIQQGQLNQLPPPPPPPGPLTIADRIKQLDDQFNSGQLSRADYITALQGLKTNAPTTVPSAPVGSSFWNRIMGALGQSGIIGAPQ